jgi:hypothetical protein
VRLKPLYIVLGRVTIKPIEYRIKELLDNKFERRRLGFKNIIAGRVFEREIVEFILFIVVLDYREYFDYIKPLFDIVFYR